MIQKKSKIKVTVSHRLGYVPVGERLKVNLLV